MLLGSFGDDFRYLTGCVWEQGMIVFSDTVAKISISKTGVTGGLCGPFRHRFGSLLEPFGSYNGAQSGPKIIQKSSLNFDTFLKLART